MKKKEQGHQHRTFQANPVLAVCKIDEPFKLEIVIECQQQQDAHAANRNENPEECAAGSRCDTRREVEHKKPGYRKESSVRKSSGKNSVQPAPLKWNGLSRYVALSEKKARHPCDKPRIINPQRYKRQQRSQSDQSQIPAETVIGPDGFAPGIRSPMQIRI